MGKNNMTNGEQMARAIEQATAKVAAKGYDTKEITTKDVLLAGMGYVASTVERRTTLIRVEGKKFFYLGVVLDLVASVLFAMTQLGG